MRVETIYLKETGPFAELRLDFQPKLAKNKADVHILVGQNGTGKSTILTAIAALFQPWQAQMDLGKRLLTTNSWVEGKISGVQIGLGWKAKRQDIEQSRVTPEIKLKHVGSVHSNAPTAWVNPAYYKTPLQTYQNAVQHLQTGASNNLNIEDFTFAAFAYSGYRSIAYTKLKAIEEVQGKTLEDALSFHKNTQAHYEKLIKWLALTKSKAALAAYRNDQEAAKRREGSITRIENLIKQIIDKPIAFEITDEPLAVNLRIDGRVSDFDVLPDGLKSILGWITDLMMRMELIPWENQLPIFERQFLLLLDEIEVHLHPAWQRKILPVLQNLFPHAQIILSTHSPFVVGSVSDAWVYPLRLDNAGNAVLDTPIKSKAGVSYPAIVEEVFGIDEEFDDVTESQLDVFEEKKKAYLQGQLSLDALQAFAASIAQGSVEVSNIVSREIRQAERLRKQQGIPAA
ncbi:AAA family ATPase [Thiothrix nivea]|uniref:ATPase AAA-type core domain-containing protein n=1 Tax=Thiothrix nivea (strain ATCC 35100 / DSM 5205 / JP2) TaxID=870187 RepID=A0A656HLV4_THINJ|nr:ATP-binding protein [Thiothrix nivea]EIJ36506.1 hypothetical protein Thini_4007 [Thiothrix nivea DSM 5205]